jgi:hypothetical protein
MQSVLKEHVSIVIGFMIRGGVAGDNLVSCRNMVKSASVVHL